MRARPALLAVIALAATPAPAAARADWHPATASAAAFAKSRPGWVSFAVHTGDRIHTFRGSRSAPSASTLKAMLLVAYLRRERVRARPLSRDQRALLSPMVRRSDDAAASRVHLLVGSGGLRRLARAAAMRDFEPRSPWGNSRVTAADLTRFMIRFEELVPPRHREFAMTLMHTVVPSQRWGIARAIPPGWKLYFKGGWGSGSGAVDHQAGLLARGDERVAIAVLSVAQGSHARGKRTLRGVAARLLRGL